MSINQETRQDRGAQLLGRVTGGGWVWLGAAADRYRAGDRLGHRAAVQDDVGRHHRSLDGSGLPRRDGERIPDRFGARCWRWAHGLLGIFFLGELIWAFVHPFDAFWSLASVIGLLLILQGGFVLISSIESRVIDSAWWLGMLAGIGEIFVGF